MDYLWTIQSLTILVVVKKSVHFFRRVIESVIGLPSVDGKNPLYELPCLGQEEICTLQTLWSSFVTVGLLSDWQPLDRHKLTIHLLESLSSPWVGEWTLTSTWPRDTRGRNLTWYRIRVCMLKLISMSRSYETQN